MKTWLHFIGKSYYPTITAFEKEAREVGITRVIPKKTLEQMSYGDRVLLAQWETPKKGKAHALIFGEFYISTVSGIGQTVLDIFTHVYPWTLLDMGGRRIERGCGSYMAGPTVAFTQDAPSPGDIVNAVKAAKSDDKLMVGGRYIQHPKKVRMKNLPHSQGAREFDYERWRMAVAAGVPRGGLSGCYYCNVKGKEVDTSEVVDFGKAKAQVVLGYKGA